MNVTATYKGQSVTIVSIVPVGSMIYVSYIDGSGNLKIGKDFCASDIDNLIIATGATAV